MLSVSRSMYTSQRSESPLLFREGFYQSWEPFAPQVPRPQLRASPTSWASKEQCAEGCCVSFCTCVATDNTGRWVCMCISHRCTCGHIHTHAHPTRVPEHKLNTASTLVYVLTGPL